jgi:hypothetical protein
MYHATCKSAPGISKFDSNANTNTVQRRYQLSPEAHFLLEFLELNQLVFNAHIHTRACRGTGIPASDAATATAAATIGYTHPSHIFLQDAFDVLMPAGTKTKTKS